MKIINYSLVDEMGIYKKSKSKEILVKFNKGTTSGFNENNKNTEAYITDISGRLVNKLFINSFETKSITLSPGQYFINFYSKNILLTKPIVIVSD